MKKISVVLMVTAMVHAVIAVIVSADADGYGDNEAGGPGVVRRRNLGGCL